MKLCSSCLNSLAASKVLKVFAVAPAFATSALGTFLLLVLVHQLDDS